MSTALAAAKRKTKGKQKLRHALGDFEDLSLSEWNKKKTLAEGSGEWTWKSGGNRMKRKVRQDATTTTSVALLDIGKLLDESLTSNLEQKSSHLGRSSSEITTCTWRQLIDGKMFTCTNVPSEADLQRPKCLWHRVYCVNTLAHPDETKIEIPNQDGFCLACFETSRLNQPKRERKPYQFARSKTPGVHEADLNRMKDAAVIAASKDSAIASGVQHHLTKDSNCNWKRHNDKNRLYKCGNPVIQHPLSGAYLAQCGYHVSKCIQGLTGERDCPPFQDLNEFGLCKNHLAALKSRHPTSSSYRIDPIIVSSPFEAPGVQRAMKKKKIDPPPRSHPLAPKYPPYQLPKPRIQIPSLLWQYIEPYYQLDNTFCNFLRTAVWHLTIRRKGDRLATRIQRTYRGRQGRRHVDKIKLEKYALYRLQASRVLQTQFRAALGRVAFRTEYQRVYTAVPLIQRMIRGLLARRLYQKKKAVLVLERFFSIAQARMIRWEHHETAIGVELQKQERQAQYIDILGQAQVFRKRRAIRCLERHVVAWKERKALARAEIERRLRHYVAASRIQHWTKKTLDAYRAKVRYHAAISIQRYSRGILCRILWSEDPGIHTIVCHVNRKTKFRYVKQTLNDLGATSYSVARRRLRYTLAALMIQRVYRGYLGRLRYNAEWVVMSKRWEWLLGDDALRKRQRHKYRLPSYNYSHLPTHHMRLPADLPPNETGFKYEYQDILDMLEDLNGLRFPTIPEGSELFGQPQIPQPVPPKPRRRRYKQGQDAQWNFSVREILERTRDPGLAKRARGISDASARLPMGQKVFIELYDGRFHPGVITFVNHEERRFNVEYDSPIQSRNGIPMYREYNVTEDRLHTHPQVKRHRLNAGHRMQEGIELIENDIQQTRLAIALENEPEGRGLYTTTSTRLVADQVPRPKNKRQEAKWYIRIVHDLRSLTPDLVADDRDLTAYAFKNIYMMEKYWLRLIHDVKFGTMSASLPNTLPKDATPLPDRAQRIEDILARAGFQYSPEFCKRPPEFGKPKAKTKPIWLPPDREEPSAVQKTQDDTMVEATKCTVDQLQKLMHQLRTAPVEFWREEKIFVENRQTRAHVCPHPACGRCFSDDNAVRLHYSREHHNQTRLAVALPETDQHLHKYWPSDVPWRRSELRQHESKVGFVECPDKKCTCEFKSSLELKKHIALVHSKLEMLPSEEEITDDPIQWLGNGISVSSINQMLDKNDPARFTQPPVCHLHPTPVEDESCDLCLAQSKSPTMPCRMMETVMVKLLHQKTAIFNTTTDLCPQVKFSWMNPKDQPKFKRTKPNLYVKVRCFCIDTYGREWMIGQLFHPPAPRSTREKELMSGFDFVYELILQDQQTRFIRLSEIVGYAMVIHCSRGMFYRKHLKTKFEGVPMNYKFYRTSTSKQQQQQQS